MITITSNEASAEQIRTVLTDKGYAVDPAAGGDKPAEAEPAADTKSPGESPSGSPAETAPKPGTGEEKPQEKQEASAPEGEQSKPGEPIFAPRRKQLEKRIERLHEQLDLETSSKSRLQAELDEVKARLAALEPKEPAKPDELVLPQPPDKADYDFDDDKFAEAKRQYNADLSKYIQEVTKRETEAARAKDREEEAQRKREEETQRDLAAFAERLDADRAGIEDYDELLEALGGDPIEMPAPVEAAILGSEHPGRLLHFFMKDVLDGDSKELNKLLSLNPVNQVRRVALLEARLDRESAKAEPEPKTEPKKPVAANPSVDDEPKPPEPPAKPKREPRPQIEREEPIEPVGSRSSGASPHLEKADVFKNYVAMRRQGVNRP